MVCVKVIKKKKNKKNVNIHRGISHICFCLLFTILFLRHCYTTLGLFGEELGNGVESKIQGGEDDGDDDIIAAFGESGV